MRQAQQNRRSRGRNNNRKGQNPLTRSYESNGPDVKIRGTPAHVAEKYMSLARDALALGDRVLAENYYQHAEHYNRIIMAYRDQQLGQSQDNAQANGRNRQTADDGLDDGDDESDAMNGDFAYQPQPPARGFEDQPTTDGGAGSEQRSASRNRPSGQRRGRVRPGQKTPTASGNVTGNVNGNSNGVHEGRNGSGQVEVKRFADSDDQPEFLRRPVRPRRRSASSDDGPDNAEQAASQAADE